MDSLTPFFLARVKALNVYGHFNTTQISKFKSIEKILYLSLVNKYSTFDWFLSRDF